MACNSPPVCLLESGPLAFDSGILVSELPRVAHGRCEGFAGLHEKRQQASTHNSSEFERLASLGAQLISVNPPMWVLDENLIGHNFVKFAEREIAAAAAAPSGFNKIDNPGSYVLQERFSIAKAGAGGSGGPRTELGPMNDLIKAITGSSTTFLDTNEGKTVTVKRYNLEDVKRQELMHGKFYALERLHIDRNRQEGSEKFRDPMKFTMLLSYDDLGGTFFPFAEPLDLLPAEMPDGVEILDADPYIESGSLARVGIDLGCEGALVRWPPSPPTKTRRGIFVGGCRGRILIFSSSNWSYATPVPLYASLHQGVLLQKLPYQGIDGMESAAKTRMVTVIGWDEKEFETSGRHECLDHEPIPSRAAFFGRTVEEEAVGIMLTGSYRAEEAMHYAKALAERRGESIMNLVKSQLEREALGIQDLGRANQAVQVLTEMNATSQASGESAVTGESILASMFSHGTTMAQRWNWYSDNSGPFLRRARSDSTSSSSASSVKPIAIPNPLYWALQCMICQGDFLKYPETEVKDGQVLPGFLSCGHIMCEVCFGEIKKHPQLVDRSNNVRCPVCRKASSCDWQSLVARFPVVEWRAIPNEDAGANLEAVAEEADQNAATICTLSSTSNETWTHMDVHRRMVKMWIEEFRPPHKEVVGGAGDQPSELCRAATVPTSSSQR